MRTGIITAGAVIFAGFVLCTPARAACGGLLVAPCPVTTSPPSDQPESRQTKPHKPLNLRKFARNGTAIQWTAKRVRITHRRHLVVTAKAPHRKNFVFAHSRRAAAHRTASAGTRRSVRASKLAAVKRRSVAVAPDQSERDATSGFGGQRDEARPQDELTPLDLAADAPKSDSQIDPATRTADALTADSPSAGTMEAANNPAPAAGPNATPALQAAPAPPSPPSPTKNQTEVTAPPAHQPAEETSWLRRIAIGVGGLVTLASAVRLFAG